MHPRGNSGSCQLRQLPTRSIHSKARLSLRFRVIPGVLQLRERAYINRTPASGAPLTGKFPSPDPRSCLNDILDASYTPLPQSRLRFSTGGPWCALRSLRMRLSGTSLCLRVSHCIQQTGKDNCEGVTNPDSEIGPPSRTSHLRQLCERGGM